MKISRLGAVSYNVWRENKPENVYDDLEYFVERKDIHIICLQEARLFAHQIQKLVDRHPDWTVTHYRGLNSNAKNTVVIYNRTLLKPKSLKFINLPESNKNIPDKWAARLRVEIVGSGREIVIFACHMLPHVELKKWWHLPRQDDFRKHIRMIRDRANDVDDSRAVIVAADWNVNFKSKIVNSLWFFPTRRFAKVGMKTNWHMLGFGPNPTLGKRYVDAIFLRPVKWLHFESHGVKKLTSDHKALIVHFTVTWK